MRMSETSSTLVAVGSTCTSSKDDVEPADLVEAGGGVDDIEALQVLDEVDEWLAHHVALARQQQVDDAEGIFGSERIHQPGADFGGARGTAIVAGNDLADGKPSGADQRHDSDQPADRLASASLSVSTGRHNGGCRLAILWDKRSPVELRRARWLRGRDW